MRVFILLLTIILLSPSVFSQDNKVVVVKNSEGMKLTVNGKDFMVNGMNWDYFPIGTNYSYNLWNQSDGFIQQALDEEMELLKNMGVNTIRVYTGIQKKWIEYIYTNYGIYTMLNHSFGRYGLTIDGVWIPNTEYSDAKTREVLLKEVTQMTADYKDTKGLLLFLLGNENNYGLFWDGAETENIPVKDRKSTSRAQAMYKVFNDATVAMKLIDSSHPIAICNGDLLFLDLIVLECKAVDILGVNAYRGVSFGDLFERVQKEYGKPILLTEFGADAFNVLTNQEDQKSQSFYLKGNWKEIYQNAAGLGKARNSIGGFTFQFSDGWWKYGQTKNLDLHDNNASWSNGGYQKDFTKSENNMNEEWFGICAKGPTNEKGSYKLYPREAYYILKDVHKLNPYASGISIATISNYFDEAQIIDAPLKARGDIASHNSSCTDKLKSSNLKDEFTTFTPAPIPTRNQSNVISLFSDAYKNVPVNYYNGYWEPWQTTVSNDFTVKKDTILNYSIFNFVGIEYSNPTINANTMTGVHLDAFIPGPIVAGRELRIIMVDFGTNGVFGGGDDTRHSTTFTAPTLVSQNWISIEIPFSAMPNLASKSHLAQLILEGGDGSVLYVDNIYFYN